jgi:hypothetical protein
MPKLVIMREYGKICVLEGRLPRIYNSLGRDKGANAPRIARRYNHRYLNRGLAAIKSITVSNISAQMVCAVLGALDNILTCQRERSKLWKLGVSAIWDGQSMSGRHSLQRTLVFLGFHDGSGDEPDFGAITELLPSSHLARSNQNTISQNNNHHRHTSRRFPSIQ